MVSHLIDKYHMDPNANDECGGLRWIHGMGGSDAMNDSGTPMDFAKVYRNDATIEALFWYAADSHGGKDWAARRGNLRILEMFLEAGEDAGESAVEAIEWVREEPVKMCVDFWVKEKDYGRAELGKYLKCVTEDEGIRGGGDGRTGGRRGRGRRLGRLNAAAKADLTGENYIPLPPI